MHVRARRALQDTLTAIRLKSSVAESGHALFPNGERYLRSRERLGRLYPPELLIETLNVAERCCFSLDSLRYEYPEELVPPGETPASHLRKLTEDGFRWRFGTSSSSAGGARLEGPAPQPERRFSAPWGAAPLFCPLTIASPSRRRPMMGQSLHRRQSNMTRLGTHRPSHPHH